jgi:hypothetical protein
MASQPTLICGVGEANHVDLATKTYVLKTWEGDINEWEHQWEPNHTVEWVAASSSPHLGKVLGVKIGAPSAGGGVRAYDTLDRVRVEWTWATDAYNPNPQDEAENVDRDVTLSWSPGLWAADVNGHILYFHEDVNKVNDLDEDANQGIMDPNTWSALNYDGNELDLVKTYYWRVVEVNDTYTPQQGIPNPPWTGSVWSFTVTGYATNPNPPDYATNVPYTGTTLSWTPGTDSNSHDVYFGTDMSSVENATTAAPMGVYKDNYDVNTYSPGDMLLGKNYYWRIDEVNENTGALVKGKLWRFTIAPYYLIDDFEDYANSDAVKAVWKDYWTNDTCAYTFLDATIIHSGAQAMRYNYDNDFSPRYAEATASMTDLGVQTDWTAGGLKALTLYFHGNKNNNKTRMYVALTDSANKTGTVVLDDPNDITRGWKGYQEWNIELQRFIDSNSVNLSSISKMTIGFGNKASPQTATGNVYFDDIRLYPSRCVLEENASGGDYDYWDEDCIVNYSDVNKLSDNWLLSSIGIVTTSQPPDANKLRHYTMNDAKANSDVLDSSSYAKHGTLYDSVDSKTGLPLTGKTSDHDQPGKISTALIFDGVDDFVNLPPLDVNTNTITFSAWATRDVMLMFSGVLYAAGPNVVAGFGLGADRLTWEQNYEMWNMWDGNDWEFDTEFIMPGDDLWSFMAMTIAPNVTTLYMYDGVELRAARNFKTNPKKNFTGIRLRIADQVQYAERFWKGKIDDVRIYNYTLTPGQVLYLARLGLAGSQNIKFPPWRPNGNADGVIDLRDFAILAGNWLDEALWP